MLEPWLDRPLEDRRAALARLINEITVSPGGVVIRTGTHDQAPSAPPQAPIPLRLPSGSVSVDRAPPARPPPTEDDRPGRGRGR